MWRLVSGADTDAALVSLHKGTDGATVVVCMSCGYDDVPSRSDRTGPMAVTCDVV